MISIKGQTKYISAGGFPFLEEEWEYTYGPNDLSRSSATRCQSCETTKVQQGTTVTIIAPTIDIVCNVEEIPFHSFIIYFDHVYFNLDALSRRHDLKLTFVAVRIRLRSHEEERRFFWREELREKSASKLGIRLTKTGEFGSESFLSRFESRRAYIT